VPLNSRAKGAHGERDAADALTRLGFTARRTVQYNGRAGDADLETSIDGVHLEVKYTERLSPYAFMAQAERDSRGRSIPVVMMRSNRKAWLVCCELNQLVPLSNAIIRAQASVLPHTEQSP
jgi:Holliday junction resolvase